MKKLLSLLSRVGIWLLMMVVAFWLLWSNSDINYFLSHRYDLHYFWLMLCILGALPVSYLLLLTGRLVFGKRCGYGLIELSVFGLGWHRDRDGQLRFRWRKPIKRFCFLDTPPAYDGSSPYWLYLMSGALFTGIWGALAFLAFFLFRSIPEMLYAAVFGLGMLMFSLLAFIPDERMPFTYARRMNRSVYLRRAREHNMIVRANQRQGGSLIDLPEDFCAPYPEELWQEPLIFAAQHNYASRMLAENRYAQAHDLFTRLYDFMEQPTFKLPQKDIQRLYLICSCAIAEMMSGAQPVLSERINEPNIELFLSRGGWGSQLLLAQCLREYLVTRNEAVAQQLQDCLESLPVPLTEGQRRILRDAQAMAADRKALEATHE